MTENSPSGCLQETTVPHLNAIVSIDENRRRPVRRTS